jgi:hypothetical protein
MTRRAEIWQERPWREPSKGNTWCVGLHSQSRHVHHSKPIHDRSDRYLEVVRTFHTYTEAIEWARRRVKEDQ